MAAFFSLPPADKELFIWVFIPYRITEEGLVSKEYDTPGTYQELIDVFSELKLQWKWQPVTLENMYDVVQEVAASSQDYTPVVLNFCSGEEDPKEPGTNVIRLLEEKNIIFTGADSIVDSFCSSKLRMKQAFVEAGVSTSPYAIVDTDESIQGVCDRLGTPLIVKPAMSMGSRGLSLQSVVYSDEQILQQVQWLVQGKHEIAFPRESIFVERFISGREFTVFLVGSSHHSEDVKIYPPVERVFHSSLSKTEQFLAHEWYWTKYEEGSPFSPKQPFCHYQLVVSELKNKLCELSEQAYRAVGGNGYARVDIRMEEDSQKLFVLEVNPNPGISSIPLSTFDDNDLGATSVGTILHLAGIPFTQLMSEIIVKAFAKSLYV